MTTPRLPSALPDSTQARGRLETGVPPLDPGVLDALASTGATVTTTPASLADHSRDWWPLSIGWAADGLVGALAQVVVSPATAHQVAAVLRICDRAGVAVTPAAGRSGVCGGTVPVHGGVLLDLTALDQIIEIDETSLVVRAEAGVFGPDLDAALRSTGSGYTLGHWPQSFDLSTVGGWLACRGAGQYSTRYGKIEDMVRGLSVVLADGTTLTTDGHGPRSATGPSLTQLFVGSEGTLGVITDATLAIHPLPAAERRGAWGFSSFDEGMEACRRILRRGATPAVLRLYDETESERNFDVATNVLIVLDEADEHLVDATMRIVSEELTAVPILDVALVERWLEHRNNVGQLAPLWANRVVVDTIEMSGRWSVLTSVRTAVLAALRAVEGTLVASVHQSHSYTDGACLYFTFAGQAPEGSERAADEAYYRACWDAATAAIVAGGAAISHHHGIGLNRGRFMAAALGDALGALRAIKGALDPHSTLNPGKLGLDHEEPW